MTPIDLARQDAFTVEDPQAIRKTLIQLLGGFGPRDADKLQGVYSDGADRANALGGASVKAAPHRAADRKGLELDALER